MSARRLIVLGSTGSIGVNTIDVAQYLRASDPGSIQIVGLAAGANATLLAEQAARCGVAHVAVADADQRSVLDGIAHVYAGPDGATQLVDAVARRGDLLLGAIVGAAGIPATLRAIDRGCDIALANKETLVAAGSIVMPRVRERGVDLLPVDSEHNAIAQCLRAGRSIDEVRRLVLTASGGPFRRWSRERIDAATLEEALDHPTWNMGQKITIDSATMMNKALEVIEAHWLFGLPADRIDVVVHPQSIVHSFVEFIDGSVIAQLGPPDMRAPIQYALTWPRRRAGCAKQMDWSTLGRLDFEPVDCERFPAVGLAARVISLGGTAGAIFNGANEAAVSAFLGGRIAFPHIVDLVRGALDAVPVGPVETLGDVFEADRAARTFVREDARCSVTPT